jgi:integrase
MTPRRTRRDQWRLTKTGTWTVSLGTRGQRVRLFQKRKDGVYYREVHQPGAGKDRRSLETRDRAEAERLGRQIVAGLMIGVAPKVASVIRLGELADAFVSESPMFLDNAEHTKADQRTRIAVLRSVIGNERDVRTLTENDVRQYEARRKTGGIRYGRGKVTPPVRQRSVQSDVKLLKQMLYWACTRTAAGGGRWLDQNPLQFVRVRGEHDVKRPVASYERFEATQRAMQELQERYENEAQHLESELARGRARARHLSWVRAELALVLLEATGRRRGSIMGLRWTDFDFSARRVTWVAEHDKRRRTWVVAYPESFFDTVRSFQRRLGAIGGYVFHRADDPESPAPPELLSQWIRKAEEHAGLPKLAGGTCHPYRRKWRTERPHHPIKAVALAGGWTDFDTMLRCYDHPDEADVLAVTSEPRKRREVGSA